MPFSGRTALITGAGSGMGQLSAWRLAAAGVRVAAIDVDRRGLELTARHAPQIHPIVCDVRDHDAVERAVCEIEDRWGPLDRVVNAAAVAPAGLLVEQPVDEIEELLAVNVVGLLNVTRLTLPGMLERGSGDLIQYGSLAGWLPSQRLGGYSASKAAVVSLTETLWHEHRGSGVRIVCACPPVVDTPLLDQIGDRGPRALARTPRIRPEEVLDSIEQALDEGRPFAFPGRGTATLWRLRRFAPGLLWARIDALERA
ncbi:SDR family NAD(P)-dependent oxidoreductase [Rhabdothermincola sediminis]|uniref:SDR family NAD(P)-dependent oxidoreductase n=1 Tax=Rhabdothermincola sediminis TaxID=2751370 RepID=UPI001AA0443E|nr:SDR family NAD(P)-dependent oxidoreductase [Rhabdothermincola sediminis]